MKDIWHGMTASTRFTPVLPFSIRINAGRRIARMLLAVSVAMSVFLICGALAAESLMPVTSQADLRVYGKVKTSLSPNRIVFQCEDAGHADILLGKLLADLFWDAGKQVKTTTIRTGSQSLTVREWQPYGAVLVARTGSSVLVLGSDSVAGVASAARHEALLRSGTALTSPLHPYPQTLDFYDLKAMKFYTGAMVSPRGYGLDSHWPFVHSIDLDSLAFQSLAINTSSPAPGVIQWGSSDYEVHEAENQKGMIVPSITVAGAMPFWMRNQFPGAMAQASPSTLPIAWNAGSLSQTAMQSWGTPLDLQRKYTLNFLKQVMQRYGASPAVGGWQIYAGEPGAELGFHDRVTESLDYSPEGRTSFQNYLKRVKGYSLSELGRRWFGDPAHFKTWEEVSIPDLYGFFGNLNDESYRIDTGWSWLPQDKSTAADSAPPASANWLPVAMPPSQEQVTLPWPVAYYKVQFDPNRWTASHAGKKVYLVCDTEVISTAGTRVWLNGKDLGEYRTRQERIVGNYGPFDVDVTGMLRDGSNELVLLVPGEGKIMGPVFLTNEQPALYPYLGAMRNAQYADVKAWQPYGLYALHNTVFREARRLDPDSSMVLASDEFGFMAGEVAALAHDFSTSVQMTGREAWYFPWWSGLGLVDGFYATSEPSATPSEPDMTRMLSWLLYDGDSSTMFFWNIEDFIRLEREDGWFTKHKSALHLEGKVLREKPAIAIFRSNVTNLLGEQSPWFWDIGRGELQSAHFDNVYVTEGEILNGKVDAYPVLFDSGSLYTDPNIIAAIQRYVEAGGTFVALQNTGWHTTTEPDSYPISRLTGFRVASTNQSGEVRFGEDLPVFHGWNGRRFPGGGLSLQPVVPGVVSLAKWQDGSTAVGYRNLGKGRIVFLGSSFWRDSKKGAGDVWFSKSNLECEFFERLFTDLGVQRTTNSSSPDVWTRKFITKNGLQEWLIAINSGSGSVTAPVSMKMEQRPDQVWDIVSGNSVPFTYADGLVTIPDVAIPERENRVFGVKRANLVGGIPAWWDEKLRYWNRVPQTGAAISIASSEEIQPADPAGLDTISVDRWKFQTVTNPAATDTSWQMPGFDDSGWTTIQNGPWNLQSEQLKDYKGTALYRFRFHVPAAWAGHRVALGLFGDSVPVVYDYGDFTLNGKPVAIYNANGYGARDGETYNYDVTWQLQPGENVLSVKVKAGAQFGGIGGAVWLAAEPILEQSQDIISGWNAVAADRKTAIPASLPGSVHGKYLVRNVELPASFRDKNVFLHLETPDQWMGLVMVNGHPIYATIYGRNYGTRIDINLAPFCKAGEPNRIELWPMATAPRGHGQEQSQETDMSISAVRIGYQGTTNHR